MQTALVRGRASREERDQGFTLIELMVVVLIIAILIAIAIPTFLGAQGRAQDRAAQSSARNELTAAKTIFTDQQSYTPATAAALNTAEPSLAAVDDPTASTLQNGPSVKVVASGGTVGIAVMSKSGQCFWLRDTSVVDATYTTAGTFFGKGASCKGSDALAAAASSW